MNLSRFEGEIRRLKQTWGERNFPETKTKMIWETARLLTDDAFEQAVNQLIDECVTAPTPQRVREACQQFMAQSLRNQGKTDVENMRKGPTTCRACGYTGLITAKRRVGESFDQTHAFRCSFCEASRILGLAEQIPLWNNLTFGDRFEVLPSGGDMTPAGQKKAADARSGVETTIASPQTIKRASASENDRERQSRLNSLQRTEDAGLLAREKASEF